MEDFKPPKHFQMDFFSSCQNMAGLRWSLSELLTTPTRNLVAMLVIKIVRRGESQYCLRHRAGLRALFRGLGLCLLRAIPFEAATSVGYVLVLRCHAVLRGGRG